MAITDTLLNIKDCFMSWHNTYYETLHTATTNAINALKIEINNEINVTKNTWQTWMKKADAQNDGYLNHNDFTTFYQGGKTNSVSKTYTNGSSLWQRQGRICIANLRGLKVGRGKDVTKEYILCAVPDLAHKPSGSVYHGSFSYDEVKWIAIRNFDNYNPTSTSYYMWYDSSSSSWKKFTKADSLTHYQYGAVIYKPIDADHDRDVYATIVYYCADNL